MNSILLFGKVGQWVKMKLHKDANGSFFFLSRLKMTLKLVFFSNSFQMLFKMANKFGDKLKSEDYTHVS